MQVPAYRRRIVYNRCSQQHVANFSGCPARNQRCNACKNVGKLAVKCQKGGGRLHSLHRNHDVFDNVKRTL